MMYVPEVVPQNSATTTTNTNTHNAGLSEDMLIINTDNNDN